MSKIIIHNERAAGVDCNAVTGICPFAAIEKLQEGFAINAN